MVGVETNGFEAGVAGGDNEPPTSAPTVAPLSLTKLQDENRCAECPIDDGQGTAQSDAVVVEAKRVVRDGRALDQAPWAKISTRSGGLVAHARFLQYIFRGFCRLRPGGWGLPGGLTGCPQPYRPVTVFRCRGGRCLAEETEYQQMETRSREVRDWQNLYVKIYRKLSGRAARAYMPFCAAGGDADGVRAAGGVPFGSDIEPQPHFEARFGTGSFRVVDAARRSDFLAEKQRVKPVVTLASPPCKKFSTVDLTKRSTAEDMIALTRDACEGSGGLYAIENVKGAAKELRDHAVLLYGSYFGLHVDRPRFFEANFDLKVDEYLKTPGLELRLRGCLGPRRKIRRLDPFGRPERADCCAGTLYPIQGASPRGFTAEEGAWAMGIDPTHMSFERLSQALPPAYGEWVFGRACMAACENLYGVPRISFDEMRRDPRAARRTLSFWLRGAGAPEADAGMELLGRSDQQPDLAAGAARSPYDEEEPPAEEGLQEQVEEVEFREVFYGRQGDFEQQWAPGEARRLTALRGETRALGGDLVGWLVGRSTHLHLSWGRWRTIQTQVMTALQTKGTRVCLQTRVLSDGERAKLRALGLERVRYSKRGPPEYATADRPAHSSRPFEWWAAGERRSTPPTFQLDLGEAESLMDPRDAGAMSDDADAKRMRSFLPVDWDPQRWHDAGLPAWIEEFMQSGVKIEPEVEPPVADHPFYEWDSQEHLLRAVLEADRHLSVGALEYVPDELLREVAATSVVHPWVVTKQKEKWRLCHDYSVGTNLYTSAPPFRLPSPWDVRGCLKPGSRFAKYDIRDGFFHVPVHPDSRRRLVVRHPGTGRLLWAPRLPFGWVGSPYYFCAVSEAIADKLRKKAAGRGIHFFVFVDDFLVVGDTDELTMEGCAMLEAELRDRGISWAPHKHRGPALCMEFLGLLLANVGGRHSISLTRGRRDGLLSLIDEWQSWQAGEAAAGRAARAQPKELASLLGKLVFASQVVWNGRPFMQSLLSSFRGLSVDWQRGVVTVRGVGAGVGVPLSRDFWQDLEWWRVHLRERYSIPWDTDELAVAAITGTDASGWGTGQLAWVDGQRVESQLAFTWAERRRPINWRELLGIVRVVEQFGELLVGRTVLVETDNMAAKGAASKRSSKAADMQELVRRLVAACEKWRIRLRLTHTPGEKLDRPDQTSRGDLVEEPRQRLNRAAFERIERAYGRFNSFLGPERHHQSGGAETREGVGEHAWFHPTYSTVGSALRLMMERAALRRQQGTPYRAMALVPAGGEAGWGAMLRHTAVVGRISASSGVLEEYRPGGWGGVRQGRDALLVVYPRAAGGRTLPVLIPDDANWRSLVAPVSKASSRPAGYVLAEVQGVHARLMSAGAFCYMPGEAGSRGRLVQVSLDFDIEDGADMGLEVHVVHAMKVPGKRSKAGGAMPDLFEIEKSATTAIFSPEAMWTVDHLVTEVDPRSLIRQRSVDSEKAVQEKISALAYRRFEFDWRKAQQELTEAAAAMKAVTDWVVLEDSIPELELYSSETTSEYECSPPPARRSTLDSSTGLPSVEEVGADPPPTSTTRAPSPGEDHLRQAMEDLSVAQNCPPCEEADEWQDLVGGDEGAIDQLRSSMASSSAAADPPERTSGIHMHRVQRGALYAGMVCAACDKPLLGKGMLVSGTLVHAKPSCQMAVVQKLERAELISRAKATGAVPLSQQGEVVGHGAASAGGGGWQRPAATISDSAIGHPTAVGRAAPGAGGKKLIPDRPEGRNRALNRPDDHTFAASATGGGQWKRIQADETLSAARKQRIRRCLAGECNESLCKYERTPCTHCTRGLHVAECGQFGRARASVGLLKCYHCRAEEMAPTREPTAARLDAAMEVMVMQLSLGSESTAGATADYNKLEQDFVVEKGLDGDEWLLPRHNAETFMAFLNWCYRDAGRARSMKAMWRHLAGVFKAWKLRDLTAMVEIKKHMKELESMWSVDADPTVSATEAMAEILIADIIPAAREPVELLVRRDQICTAMEAYGGARIGEVADAGQGHGAMCENIAWVEDMSTGEGFMDVFIPTSKTGHARYTGISEVPAPRVNMKKILFSAWRTMGMATKTKEVGGLSVTWADRYVVRVSLLGMGTEDLPELVRAINTSSSPTAKAELSSTIRYATARLKADGPGSELKKFINVAYGREGSIELTDLVTHLEAHGFKRDRVHMMSAPFISATTGGIKPRPTMMPLSSTTMTGGVTKKLLVLAALAANIDPAHPDPDLSIPVKEIEAAKWGTHSMRRFSDRRVKVWCKHHGLDKTIVDAMHGWKEAERRLDMQTHYDELNLRIRLERSRVTGRPGLA